MRRVLLILLVTAAIGCDAGDMRNEGRVKPYEPNRFFAQGMSARQPPAGTVARTPLSTSLIYGERNEQAGLNELPYPLTAALLQRGQEQFNIHCSACHGQSGHGDGMIVRRGFTRPPSYHLDRLREAPLQHFVNVITNGFGAMYSYADRVSLEDRYAIAAYIRALQLSQHAPADLISQAEMSRPAGGGQ